ncbi:MAG: hypothetical protein HY855_00660 [Burkholderiales bacterium]|nr:hypothetical protein [Burkholderiales bacterium]
MHNSAPHPAVAHRTATGAQAAVEPNPQSREAQVHQALIELFPHLRSQAYNALREMFPTPRQS